MDHMRISGTEQASSVVVDILRLRSESAQINRNWGAFAPKCDMIYVVARGLFFVSLTCIKGLRRRRYLDFTI